MNKGLFALICVIGCLFLVLQRHWAPSFDAVDGNRRAVQNEGTDERRTTAPSGALGVTAEFDVSRKAHYFNPETATTAHGKPLKWVLGPFHPSAEEFQVIARYEYGVQLLNTSTSDAAYQAENGRREWKSKLERLRQKLVTGLGEDRFARYEYVIGFESHYAPAWRILDVNGISEERVEELRAMAARYNLSVFGETISHRSESEGRPLPDFETVQAIKRTTREQIRKQFGDQVLQDILTVPTLDLFNSLNDGVEGEYPDPWDDLATRERLEVLYLVSFDRGQTLPLHLKAESATLMK